MNRRPDVPDQDSVERALAELLDRAREMGTSPSVLALARKFGLTNTTFRRHFPGIARQIAEFRHSPPSEEPGQPGVVRYDQLLERNAKLRRANRDLTDHLRLAAAHIQRLAIENDRLARKLESVTNVTRIGSGMPRPRYYSCGSC